MCPVSQEFKCLDMYFGWTVIQQTVVQEQERGYYCFISELHTFSSSGFGLCQCQSRIASPITPHNNIRHSTASGLLSVFSEKSNCVCALVGYFSALCQSLQVLGGQVYSVSSPWAFVVYFCFAAESSTSTIDPRPSLMRHKHTPEALADLLNTALLNSAAV